MTMVAGLTVGSKKYEACRERCEGILERGKPYVADLTEQIDRDTEAFDLVSAAFRMPKGTEEEKQVRSQAIQAGTLKSTEAPLETMRLALEALRNGKALLAGFNESAASDLGVAALELLAAVRGAWLNVLINIGSLRDRERAEAFRQEGERILREAEALSEEIYSAVLEMVG